jgi:hypothetical protein
MAKQRESTSLFIGETSRGRAIPVFWDPHTPIINNKPPVCLITGSPGSGKTFLGLTLAAQSALLGKTTVVIDPKGDFLALNNIRDDLGQFVVIDLDRGKPGLLDPCYMATTSEDKISLVIEVLDIFLGGLSGEDLTVLAPIVKDVIAGPNPSLQKVLENLRGSEKSRARDIGTQLDLISKMKYAKLCFAPGNSSREALRLNEGLTVFTMVNLQLPAPNEETTTRQGKFATGLMFLLTDFLRRIMMNDNSKTPKTIVIDEAHVILGCKPGANSISSMALLGRSKYLALLLITQNSSHLDHINIENTISTRFAFQTENKEAALIIKDMALPQGENFERSLIDLKTGECLMKDYMNRYSTVQISAWRKKWTIGFSSNPLDVKRKTR